MLRSGLEVEEIAIRINDLLYYTVLLDEGTEFFVGDLGGRIDEEDVRPSSSKGKGDGHAKDDEGQVRSSARVSWTTCRDGITYASDDGTEVKIDRAGRSYPVGKDGFRLMKRTRPPEYTPAKWAMTRKYYTEEEKAEVKGGGKKKKEEPKSKGSEISTPAEAQTLQMPGAKRTRAMLRNR